MEEFNKNEKHAEAYIYYRYTVYGSIFSSLCIIIFDSYLSQLQFFCSYIEWLIPQKQSQDAFVRAAENSE